MYIITLCSDVGGGLNFATIRDSKSSTVVCVQPADYYLRLEQLNSGRVLSGVQDVHIVGNTIGQGQVEIHQVAH